MRKKNYILLVILIVFFIFSFVFIKGYQDRKEAYELKIVNEPPKYYTECLKYKTLWDFSYCLRDYVETIYNFKETGNNQRSIEEIIKEGGDCGDYSRFYEEIIKELRPEYATQKFSLMNKDGFHTFLIVSDYSGYCNMDLLRVECYVYEGIYK